MSNNSKGELYLIGFRIEPDIFEPQLYTIYVESDRPIMYQGQPIVFANPELADVALIKSDCGATDYGPAPKELYVVFDIAEAIYDLCEKDELEGNSRTLDCINVLLDFINCFDDDPMPVTYRKTLESLADHLTFNTEFKSFIESENITRQAITDAFYWTLGMAVYQMKIIN